MPRVRRLLLALVLPLVAFPVLVTGVAGPAHACSCAMVPLPQRAASSDAVFVAELVEPLEEGTVGTVTAPAVVEAVYAGDVPVEVTIRTGAQSSACGLTGLSAGTRMVFFTSGPGPEYAAGACDGNVDADPATLRRIERVLGPGDAPRPVTVEVPDEGSQTAAATTADGSIGTWPWILAGSLALAAAGAVVVRRTAPR